MVRQVKSLGTSGSPVAVSQPNIRMLDSEDSAVTQVGTWASVEDAEAVGGSYLKSNTTNSYVQYSFKGSALWVRFKFGSDCGKASITIDGTSYPTIDLYNSLDIFKYVNVAVGLDENTSHTVKIAVAGTKNASSTDYYVNIDAFIYRTTEEALSLQSIEYIDLINVINTINRINLINLISNIANIELVEELSNIGNIANISSVDKIDQLSTIEKINELSTINQISLVANITEISNVTNISNIENISLIQTISSITGVSNIGNIANVANISNIANISLIQTVSAITGISEIGRIVQIQDVLGISEIGDISNIANISLIQAISAITGISNIGSIANISNIENVSSIDLIDQITTISNIDQIKTISQIKNIGDVGTSIGRTELLRNPSFETGDLTGWLLTTGTATVTASPLFEGEYACKLEVGAVIEQTLPPVPLNRLVISGSAVAYSSGQEVRFIIYTLEGNLYSKTFSLNLGPTKTPLIWEPTSSDHALYIDIESPSTNTDDVYVDHLGTFIKLINVENVSNIENISNVQNISLIQTLSSVTGVSSIGNIANIRRRLKF